MAKRTPKQTPATAAPPMRTDEPAAEWVELARLKAWDRNPRKIDAAQIDRVVASIRRFGFGAPVLARKADGEVIAGHTRVNAAMRMGLTRVPVRWMDLDAEAAHLLALADNRLTELGQWDQSDLLDLLGDLRQRANDAALVAGWSDAEIDDLIKRVGDDILTTATPGAADDQSRLDVKVCPHCGGVLA